MEIDSFTKKGGKKHDLIPPETRTNPLKLHIPSTSVASLNHVGSSQCSGQPWDWRCLACRLFPFPRRQFTVHQRLGTTPHAWSSAVFSSSSASASCSHSQWSHVFVGVSLKDQQIMNHMGKTKHKTYKKSENVIRNSRKFKKTYKINKLQQVQLSKNFSQIPTKPSQTTNFFVSPFVFSGCTCNSSRKASAMNQTAEVFCWETTVGEISSFFVK